MRRLAIFSLIGIIFTGINSYASNQIKFKLKAVIPVKCDATVLSSGSVGNQYSMSVKRYCNTYHSVVISNPNNFEAVVEYENQQFNIAPGSSITISSDAAFDEVESITAYSTDGNNNLNNLGFQVIPS